MKNITSLLFFLLISYTLLIVETQAQNLYKYRSKQRKIEVASGVGMFYQSYLPVDEDKVISLGLRAAPMISYLINERFSVGATFEVQTFKHDAAELPTQRGYGLFSNYYFIERFNKWQVNKIMKPLVGLLYLRTNYLKDTDEELGVRFTDRMENNQFGFALGFQFIPWRGLVVGCIYHYLWHFDKNMTFSDSQLNPRVMVGYHF